MASLDLKDSNLEGSVKNSWESSACILAVDKLKKEFENGKVEVLSLFNYRPCAEYESPVWYEVESTTTKYYTQIVDNCRFFTSHYIGTYSTDGVKITIRPRFGEKIFNYLIGFATNLYLPIAESDYEKSKTNSYWLLALIWKSMLNKALTLGQIPRNYVEIKNNQKHFRGRLDIAKHIRANLCDASRFYCSYGKLSMDNTINRTIRYSYQLLKDKVGGRLLNEFAEYDKKLESMGVKNISISTEDIDRIKYNRLNAPYRELMQICKIVIKNKQAESSSSGTSNVNISYFIDVAELWEAYLLKLLQRNLPDCRVYSPNALSGDYLIEKEMREIRPDIIIEKDGRVVMIIDAKYKFYEYFGRRATHAAVQRDDLYQMTTYLYHYGTSDNKIIGLFTSPVSCKDGEVFSFQSNCKHQIGLVNLDIHEFTNLEEVHQSESKYIETIRELLETI